MLPAHRADDAGPARALGRTPYRRHRGAPEVEGVGVQDRLVAERQHPQPELGVHPRAGLARGEHRRHPAELARLRHPLRDGVAPRLRPADRVTGGERDPVEDAVGDHGLLVAREDRCLVTPGGEVAEGVVVTVPRQQPPDRELAVAGPVGLVPRGAQEQHDTGHEADRQDHRRDLEKPERQLVELPGSATVAVAEADRHHRPPAMRERAGAPAPLTHSSSHAETAARTADRGQDTPRRLPGTSLEPAGEGAPDPPQPPQEHGGEHQRDDVEHATDVALPAPRCPRRSLVGRQQLLGAQVEPQQLEADHGVPARRASDRPAPG